MPLYQYHCGSCNKEFDAYAPMEKSAQAVDCPVCNNTAPRVIYPCAVKAFPGTVTYDKMHGFIPGSSSMDYSGYSKDLKDRPRIDNLGANKKGIGE